MYSQEDNLLRICWFYKKKGINLKKNIYILTSLALILAILLTACGESDSALDSTAKASAASSIETDLITAEQADKSIATATNDNGNDIAVTTASETEIVKVKADVFTDGETTIEIAKDHIKFSGGITLFFDDTQITYDKNVIHIDGTYDLAEEGQWPSFQAPDGTMQMDEFTATITIDGDTAVLDFNHRVTNVEGGDRGPHADLPLFATLTRVKD